MYTAKLLRTLIMTGSPFLNQVRIELRTRQYSIRTEKSYLYWIRWFIKFNDVRHPADMGNSEIERFCTTSPPIEQ
ncbi:phage integrase N-terminal SAM-like domain-containing protein [Photobacterium sp. MCCC 1A19761]